MHFTKETLIRATPEKVFAFHELPDAIERLIPPGEGVKVIQKADITNVGSRAIIEQKIFGIFPSQWMAEHTKYEPPYLFEDVQISGPFASWRHQHVIKPHPNGAVLSDQIEYKPPLWILGQLAAPFAIIPKLEKMFEYRHKVTKDWCEKGS